MDAIKINVERGNINNKMTAVTCCDTETFLEGNCVEADCSHDEGRIICCVICENLFDCTRPCSRVEIGSDKNEP